MKWLYRYVVPACFGMLAGWIIFNYQHDHVLEKERAAQKVQPAVMPKKPLTPVHVSKSPKVVSVRPTPVKRQLASVKKTVKKKKKKKKIAPSEMAPQIKSIVIEE